MSAPSYRWGDNFQSHLLKRRGSEKMECLGDLNSSCQIFAWWGLTVKSSRPGVFCKKGVLRSLTKFTGKHLCQSLFFNKVAGLRPATLVRKRPTGVFLWILSNVKKDFVKLIMTLRAVFKMLILAPHLALNISSTADFSLVQLIVPRFIIAKFAESIDPFGRS